MTTNNKKTGLTVPKPRADKTTEPQCKAMRKASDEKRITDNVMHGHGKSALRPENTPTMKNPLADNENASMEHYGRADSNWVYDGKMVDHQPVGPGGKWLKTRELGIMPEDALGTYDPASDKHIPIKSETDRVAVQKAHWQHQVQ
jgi:hypothetical protein